ncbi:MAG: hypothetical protein HN742_14920 [Lentisphaerae bacterium]|nr:hypothetical protein [Lentisphaerota bacterium]MBT4816198.1 hypothetical protein [Lentisphaerota bacterium]MBT5609555.1 hypothetical protein [Lentisphaerota bacterium]MBT7058461.1 hypothetical protein [Lentisphaerota bacterium]MBT7843170.1 hypothetical protein [Lentisphaerota bacterium]
MFRPVSMVKINVLMLDKYLNEMTRSLGGAGLVHLIDAVSQSRDSLLFGVDRKDDIQDLERLERRAAHLVERLGVDPNAAPPPLSPFDKKTIARTLRRLERKIDDEEDAISQLLNASGMLDQEVRRLSDYPFQRTRLAALRDLSHLYIVTGRIAPSAIPPLGAQLEERAVLLHQPAKYRNDSVALVLTSRRNRWAVESDLKQAGFKSIELPEEMSSSPAEAQDEAEKQLQSLASSLDERRQHITVLHDGEGLAVSTMHRQIMNALAVAHAQEKFGKSTHIYCISGWIPNTRAEEVTQLVSDVTDGTGVIEIVPPTDDDRVRTGIETVPVQFTPSPVLKPFQQIVANFGAPRYDELDPSLFVALTFVVMFGIMFGDVGQGAVVALLGLWMRKTENPAVKPFRDGGLLLVLCGMSSVVFGFLYGSVFGYENEAFLKPLWLSPIHDVTRLLIYAVVFGVIAISIGIFLNIVNKMRTGKYFEGIFDRFGVIGIIFYWGALGIGVKAAVKHELRPIEAVVVIVIPLALLFIREPLHNMLHRSSPFHGGAVSILVEACVETMETLTAFLGGTVSFVRIGVMALSHACLCLVTYEIAGVLKEMPMGGLWAFLAIVAGNITIIVLEGMIAMIQAIRLEYYELFSKYFSGDGVLYAPFQFSERSQTETEEQGETNT